MTLACGCTPMLDSEHAPDCDRNHWPHDECSAEWITICRGGPTADCGDPSWHSSHRLED